MIDGDRVQIQERRRRIDSLPYTVIRISAEECGSPGRIHTGTGFFYAMKFGEDEIPLIITNKHVVDNKSWLEFDFAQSDDQNGRLFGPPRSVRLPVDELQILRHPDSDVDLALIPCLPMLQLLWGDGIRPFYLYLSKANFAPDHIIKMLSAASSVLMIGFPNGLMDTTNNLPIVRRGTLATHYRTNYLGKPNFMIDIAAFGGSSGSPIFAYYDGVAPNPEGGVDLLGDPAVYLIGVLHSGPVLNAQGRIVPAPVPTDHLVAEMRLMIHLGYALKAHLIEDLSAEIEAMI